MLVMTSGNLHNEPIVTDDDQALVKFAGIADAVIAGRADSAVAAEGEKAADEEFVEVVEAAPAEAPAAE